LIDETTIEVDFMKGQSMNELFERLNQSGVQISSMRNKSNRLEELFLKLTTTEGSFA